MSPEDLRRALFDAISRRDDAAFHALLQQYTPMIVANVAMFAKVPIELREDPRALQAYANNLIVLAEVLHDMGHPELMSRMRGGGAEGNLIDRWQAAFEEADRRVQGGAHRDAIAILGPVLDEMTRCKGTAIDAYRAKMLGLLGTAHFRLGEITHATQCMRAALEECRRTNDAEGIRIYEGNLAHIARAQGIS